ncbi:MAG: CFI-box-CTERM domain-containing protein [Candidatus Ratteibacteria bacterium]
MMKKRILPLLLFLLSGFFLFTPSLSAKILGNTVDSLVDTDQGILPNSNWVVIFGIDITSDRIPLTQYLTSVTVNMFSYNGFELANPGIAIMNRGGGIIATGNPGTIAISGGAIIPGTTTAASPGYDFYVAIRTSDYCPDASYAYFSIPSGGVSYSNPTTDDSPRSNAGATTATITCELLLADIMPMEYDNFHSIGENTYPMYLQYQPGEMIRPRYDRDPFEYQYAPSDTIRNQERDRIEQHVPQVIPWETRTPVLAISCAQRNLLPNGTGGTISDPVDLRSVKITLTDTGTIGNFDPNKTFRPVELVGNRPGITLWRDTNANGIWDPTDAIVPVDYSGGGLFQQISPTEWTLTLSLINENIEPLHDKMYDYFIVIETREDVSVADPYATIAGSDYKIWIERGDVRFSYANPYWWTGIDQGKTKTIYNNLYVGNISPVRVDPTDPSMPADPTSSIIPLFGINAASSSNRVSQLFPDTRFESIRIELFAKDGFNPNFDLQPFTNDESAGISLWRDNKTVSSGIGVFDASDSLVPTNATPWISDGMVNHPEFGYVTKYHSTISTQAMASDNGYLPQEDLYLARTGESRGYDLFLCMRTNDSLAYNSRFYIEIPVTGIQCTAPKAVSSSISTSTGEIQGNVSVKMTNLLSSAPFIGPSSDPVPVIRIELNDNNSGKLPLLYGLSVELYDKGNFNLTDLASFDPIAPDYDGLWYRPTNFNPNSLQQCGVVIYKALASDPTLPDLTQPVLISKYRRLLFAGSQDGYQFEFQTPISIPSILYVVIRTSATFTSGDAFGVSLVGWGRIEADWNTWGSHAFNILDGSGNASNIYARFSSSVFNPPPAIGTLLLNATPSFNGIGIEWRNLTNVSPNEFIKYELTRTSPDQPDYTFPLTGAGFPWSTLAFFDSRYSTTPPMDGIEYTYTLTMTYLRAGEPHTIISSPVTAQIYSIPDMMKPTNLKAINGVNAIYLTWTDNSWGEYKATSFLIERKRAFQGDEYFTDLTVTEQSDPFSPFGDFTAEPYIDYIYRVSALREISDREAGRSAPSANSNMAEILLEPSDGIQGGGGGCFIATAAFGSAFESHVVLLREFRDTILLRNKAGKSFVAWYYYHAPQWAAIIESHTFLKPIVRILLSPLVFLAYLLVKGLFWYLLLLTASLSLLYRFPERRGSKN